MPLPTNPKPLQRRVLLVTGMHGQSDRQSGREQLTTIEETELFYKALEEVLVEVEFLDPQSPKHLRRLMRRLRRLFNRIRLNRNEMNILRGILTAIRNKRSN